MPSSRYYRFKKTGREEKIKRLKILFFSLSLFILTLTALWLIFLSSFFGIQNINMPDDTAISRNDVLNIISNIALLGFSKNLIILSKSRLKSELTAAFPSITDIAIEKKLFHTVTIGFTKRIQIGIWCDADNCFYFDKDGIIFAPAPQTEGSLILKVKDSSKNDISLGSKVLSGDQINFIIVFMSKIAENNKIKILEFKIKPNLSVELEAITNKNWSIYLDEKQEPKEAAGNLLSILEEVVMKTENVEYIDLRIPSRVFYKLK